MPSDTSIRNALSGEKRRKALAGPDWTCRYCQTLQSRLNAFCEECGVDMQRGAQGSHLKAEHTVGRGRGTATKLKAYSTVTKPYRSLVHDQPVRDFQEALRREIDGVEAKKSPEPLFKDGPSNYREPAQLEDRPLAPPAPPVSSDSLTEEELKSIKGAKFHFPSWSVYAVVGAVALALILWLIFRTKEVDASITALSWEHRVLVDRYQIWRREGWTPDFSSFDVHDEGPRIHHYDHVRVGSHRESYQESYACGTIPGRCRTTPVRCSSNKNGTANCSGGDTVCDPDQTKYCSRTAYRTIDDYEDQARYQEWYSWHVWDWGYNRTVRHTGTTDAPSWPTDQELTVPLAPGEKERNSREAEYKVTFTGDGDRYEFKPRTEAEFKAYRMGEKRRLRVGVAHGVEVLPELK
jgi:hypothetical protein